MNEVIHEANHLYNWQLLSEAGNLPLDLARSLLTSHSTSIVKAQCAGRKRLTGSHVQCPRCNTPRIANLIQSRLLGCPRKKQDVIRVIKKEKKWPKKLTSREKSLLEAFRSRKNTIEVTCLVCHHKTRELFPAPVKKKIIPQGVAKKQKKKRSVKEVNAGLTLSPKTQDSVSRVEIGKRSNIKPDVNLSRTDGTKKKKKLTENANKEGKKAGEVSELDKTLAQRLENSITKSFTLDISSSSKTPQLSDRSQKLPGTEPSGTGLKTKKQKGKQLSYLKNSVIKNIVKGSNSTQNNTLGDFLSSLF